MKIQWYPGHIAKARREIKDHIKLVDIVIEIIDARCPVSSINFLSEEIKDKKHLLILNKSDLADEKKTKEFISKNISKNPDVEILALDSRSNDIKKYVDKRIDKQCAEIIDRYKKKGITNVLLKAMVVGMPNVGKSTFINSYIKKKVNNVANTPGVTKRLQWAKISDKLLLLDTPGVTIPKFDSEKIGINLAIVGSLNDDIVEKQDLVYEFIEIVKKDYFDMLKKRYKLTKSNKDSVSIDIMNEIAINTACLKRGKEINYDKVSNLILTDFRKGLIGKISLE